MARDKKTGAKPVKRSKMRLLVNIAVVLALIFILRNAAILFLLGMLPSFVAGYVDQTKDRNGSKVIFTCNLSGVIPYLVQLWVQGISSDNMNMMLANPNVWMVMYSSAAFGWLLVWLLPRVVHFTLDAVDNANVNSLHKKQQAIVDEWGMQVEVVSRRALRNAVPPPVNDSGNEKVTR